MSTESSPLLLVTDIARVAGYGVSAVSNWRKRHASFPVPIVDEAGVERFREDEVLAWLQATGKPVSGRVLKGARALQRLIEQSGGPWERDRTLMQVLALLALAQVTRDSGSVGPRGAWEAAVGGRIEPIELLRRCEAELRGDHRHDLYRLLEALLGEGSRDHDLSIALCRAVDELPRGANALARSASELIGWVADQSGVVLGEYVTPPALVGLSLELLAPLRGVVLDPAAGIGAFLAKVADSAPSGTVSLLGQEVAERPWHIAMLHLHLYGLLPHLAQGDALRSDAFAGQRADRVFVDPPVGVRVRPEMAYEFERMMRFPAMPLFTDWLWVQHALDHLKPDGRAVLLLPSATLSRAGRDVYVRSQFVAEGYIEAVIDLPAAGRFGSGPGLAMLLLRGSGAPTRDRVLFIDARQHGEGRRGKPVTLSADAVARIVGTVRRWRLGESIEEPLFAAEAKVSEICGATDSHGVAVDLSPRRFITYVARSADDGAPVAHARLEAAAEDALAAWERGAAAGFPLRATARSWVVAADGGGPSYKVRALLQMPATAGRRQDLHGLGEKVQWIPTSAVSQSSGHLRAIDEQSLTSWRHESLAQRGDLLVASRGIEPGGRVSCATVDLDGAFGFSDSLLLLRPNPDLVLPAFLRLMLTSESGRAAIAAVTTGGHISNLRPKALEELEFCIPPLDVQHRVVAAIDVINQAEMNAAVMLTAAKALRDAVADGVTQGFVRPRG